MATPLSETLRNLLQSFLNLFRRQKSLSDFSHDELRMERTRLEAAEQRILNELERLEREKAELFEAAKKETSAVVRQVKARKIRDINHRIDNLQGNLGRLGKLVRVVDSVMAQKEAGRLHQGAGPVVDTLLQTDSLSLQDWVGQVVAGEAVAEEKIDQLLAAFDDAEDMGERLVHEDAEVNDILAQIEAAAAAEAADRAQTEARQAGPEAAHSDGRTKVSA